jgi:transposase
MEASMLTSREERKPVLESDSPKDDLRWLVQVMKNPKTLPWNEEMKLKVRDTTELLAKVESGSHRERKNALALLGRLHGITIRNLCRCLGTAPSTICRNWKTFKEMGTAGVFRQRPIHAPKADDQKIKAAVFSIIHSPPSEHGINRTSWKLKDICRCLLQQNIHVSKELVSKIIREAGYKWRKAKTVLTSNDPEYSQKLDRIKSVLSTLRGKDRFCSIDEFGPFAIKAKGGKILVGPTEYPHVPQFQKSKGWLIVTAALELSQNQVTHFYSKAKNTTEMIKLLEVLLERYRGCDRLYFSWDAASWHASKALQEKVRTVNLLDYREASLTPYVELVPLPKSAQFLNVIESVFSGMAKAIIHNSDYKSVADAMKAIDRYFQERNQHFLSHPKKAGKKIWGDEPSASEFADWNNCKDSRWR